MIETYEQLIKIERKQKARVNEQEKLKFLPPYGSRFKFLLSATGFRLERLVKISNKGRLNIHRTLHQIA